MGGVVLAEEPDYLRREREEAEAMLGLGDSPGPDVAASPTPPAPLRAPRVADADGWPTPDPAVFQGPLGAYVLAAAVHTEADPMAILANLLAGVGCLANSGPHIVVGNDRHPAALFVLVVGATGDGAKGTAYSQARIVLDEIDSDFTSDRILGGFGSGEVLVETLGARPDDDDEGLHRERDSRLIIREGEFASILKVSKRESSTLGQTIRNGWDGSSLAARTRGRSTVSVRRGDYHLAVTADITPEELRNLLTESDAYGGTLNRFLLVAARRARRLPEGGNVPHHVAVRTATEVAANLAKARRHGRYERTSAAVKRWAEIYDELADDQPPGLLGAAISRARPQCLRLALAYAVADGADRIDVTHLEAARAFWRYSRATAEWVFPRSTQLENTLLNGIVAAGDRGLDRTALHALLGRNSTAHQIDDAVSLLVEAGQAEEVRVPPASGRGRPSRVVRRVTP